MTLAIEDKKIGFIGMGHLGQAILRGLITSDVVPANRVYVTNRSPGKIEKVVKKYQCHGRKTNEELIDASDVIVLATKPQDLLELLEGVRGSLTEDKVVISLAAGLSLKTLKSYVPDSPVVRIMTNTPISICAGTIGMCLSRPDIVIEGLVKKLFSPLGYVVSLSEGDPLSAFTVASSSGTGFILEVMQYWQEWIQENGVEAEEAREIVIETFLGTALLAKKEGKQSFAALVEQVASKKGVTAAGLGSMRELELEGIFRMSFNKSLIRGRELGQQK